MLGTSRFGVPSEALSLAGLSRRAQRGLWPAISLAVVMHLVLAHASGLEAEQRVAKPLTTQFVKRRPKLTKALELKKRPAPKRRPLQRRMIAVKARAGRREVSVHLRPTQLVGDLAKPTALMGRGVSFCQAAAEPKTLAGDVTGSREPCDAVDTSLEMVDVEALDTGKYQAMVIQDPNDKRNVKGYLHLAMARPYSVHNRNTFRIEERVSHAVRRLVARLNDWTLIRANVATRVSFDCPELLQTPWVYLWLNFRLDPTEQEIENLGKYLLNGGFFFFEGMNRGEQQGERHLMRFVEAALESQALHRGMDWQYESLPNAHPIFHCYYDFPDVTPMGEAVVAKAIWGLEREDGIEPLSRGIQIGARLVALNTNQGYATPWGDWGNPKSVAAATHARYDPTVQFQFGINTIIFALTQEGSITKRVMDTVSH